MDKLSELLMRCKKGGSPDEWNDLLEALHPSLILALEVFCGRNDALIEDFTQEAMLRIVRHIKKCRAKTFAAFRSWCITISVRLAADHYRKAGVKKLAILDPASIQKLQEASAELGSGSIALSADVERARELLKSLGSPCCELLTLHFVHGLSYADIAKTLGKSYDSVRVAIPRCLDEAQRKFD